MYAVVMTGGKQYRVGIGDHVKVELVEGDVGDEVILDKVLAVGDGENLNVGTPVVEGAMVKAEIVELGRHPKVVEFKKRRRKDFRKKIGHRQHYAELAVREIVLPGTKNKSAESSSEAE